MRSKAPLTVQHNNTDKIVQNSLYTSNWNIDIYKLQTDVMDVLSKVQVFNRLMARGTDV